MSMTDADARTELAEQLEREHTRNGGAETFPEIEETDCLLRVERLADEKGSYYMVTLQTWRAERLRTLGTGQTLRTAMLNAMDAVYQELVRDCEYA